MARVTCAISAVPEIAQAAVAFALEHYPQLPVVARIAAGNEPSLRTVRRSGMVEGVRGPGGGYQLSRRAESISIAEIISAVDETIDSTRCGGQANCQNAQPCLTHDLWMGLSDQIRQYLDSITLQDVLTRSSVREVSERQDQHVLGAALEMPLQRGVRL